MEKEPDVPFIENVAPDEFEATVVITNDLGLHARPAALVAQAAQKYDAEVALIALDKTVDAKSILDILSLAAGKGTTLTVRCKGRGAEDCVRAIASLARSRFNEESR